MSATGSCRSRVLPAYGVVIDPETYQVDAAATGRLRADKRSAAVAAG